MITKEKQQLLLNLACDNRHDLRLEFARILYHPGESPAFIQPHSLNLVGSAITPSS